MIDGIVREKLKEIAESHIPEYVESEKLHVDITKSIEEYLDKTVKPEQWEFLGKYPLSVQSFKIISIDNRCEKFKKLCKVSITDYDYYDHYFNKINLSKEYPNIFLKDTERYKTPTIYVDKLLGIPELEDIVKNLVKMITVRYTYRRKICAFMDVIRDSGFTITKLKENFQELYELYKIK